MRVDIMQGSKPFIPTVTVNGVGFPTSEDAFRPIGRADILSASAGLHDKINPCDTAQGDVPLPVRFWMVENLNEFLMR